MEQIVGVGHYHHENFPSCYLYNKILFVIDSMGKAWVRRLYEVLARAVLWRVLILSDRLF